MFIKRYLLVISSILMVLGVAFSYRKRILMINWFNLEESLFEIYIYRINLKESVYDINSRLNNVDYHIELLDNSIVDKDLYFLASHSGSGYASYFDDLIYLEKGDFIELDYLDRRVVFIVDEIFYINKSGYFDTYYSTDGGMLFLITCSLDYTGRQLIVKARMV